MYLKAFGELTLHGSELTRQKPLLILSYLVLEGRTSRRELSDLFFSSTKNPRDSLSSALKLIRKQNEELITGDKQQVSTTVACDAVKLLNAFERADLNEISALYKGIFLKGLDLNLNTELEEWVYGTRELLANKVRSSYLRLALSHAKETAFQEAASLAEKAYFLAGASEPDSGQLKDIYALLLLGDNPAKKLVHEEASDFGIELGDSIEESMLHLKINPKPIVPSERNEILEGSVANNLPLQTTAFIGRSHELTEIASVLEKEESRLITILGPGGMGKTRLALQVAKAQLEQRKFSGGVYFVPFESISKAEQIPIGIADAMSLLFQGQRTMIQQLSGFIGNRHILLLLDNVEHLVEMAAVSISDLLTNCPNLKIVVTSRESLNTKEEWLVHLEGLSYPADEVSFPDGVRFDAIALFYHYAQKQNRDFLSEEENYHQVKLICGYLAGWPLAIELAASWLRVLTVEAIAQEVQVGQAVFQSRQRGIIERHQSLRATFEYSWQLLSEKEKQILKDLSICQGGFRRDAARAISDVSLLMLSKLVDKSMLKFNGRDRYNFHPLLQQFIYEVLELDSERLAKIQVNHARWYIDFLNDSANAYWIGGNLKERFDILEADLINIELAWKWAIDNEALDWIKDSFEGLLLFANWRHKLSYANALMSYVQNLKSDTDLKKYILSLALSVKGICIGQEDLYHHEMFCRQAIAYGNELEEEYKLPAMMLANTSLAVVLFLQGKFADSIELLLHAERVAKIFLSSKDQTVQFEKHFYQYEAVSRTWWAWIYYFLGLTHAFVGKYEQAISYCQSALNRLVDIDNPLQSRVSSVLSGAYLQLGDLKNAAQFVKQALDIAYRHDAVTEKWFAHIRAGEIALGEGTLEEIEEHCKALKSIKRTHGEDTSVSRYYYLEGRLKLAKNDLVEAKKALELCITRAMQIRSTRFAILGLVGSVELNIKQGDYVPAAKILGFILSSEAAEQKNKIIANSFLDDLKSKLSSEEIDVLLTQGKTQTLENLIMEVLV